MTMRRKVQQLLPLVVLLAAFAAPAHATTLVNDPTHPFTARQFSILRAIIRHAHVPTPPGTITLSHQACDTDGANARACALNRRIDLGVMSRFDLLHELGHEDQMFDGPGDPTTWPDTSGWSTSKKQTLAALVGVPAAPFFATTPGERTLAEVTADAYAECALRTRWVAWWRPRHVRVRTARDGSVSGHGYIDTTTPYDFRAGPRTFKAICAAIRGT